MSFIVHWPRTYPTGPRLCRAAAHCPRHHCQVFLVDTKFSRFPTGTISNDTPNFVLYFPRPPTPSPQRHTHTHESLGQGVYAFSCINVSPPLPPPAKVLRTFRLFILLQNFCTLQPESFQPISSPRLGLVAYFLVWGALRKWIQIDHTVWASELTLFNAVTLRISLIHPQKMRNWKKTRIQPSNFAATKNCEVKCVSLVLSVKEWELWEGVGVESGFLFIA